MGKSKKKNNNTNKNRKTATKKSTSNKIEETKLYKTEPIREVHNKSKNPVAKKSDKNNNKKKGKKKWTVKRVILRLILVLFILGVIVAGIGLGILFGLLGREDFKITKEDLTIGSENSTVVNLDNKQIAKLSGDETREIISKDQMGAYLPNAFVAIEDERFEEHNGIDIKRTALAFVEFVFNGGNSSFGGSTITQQLVKNITDDKEDEGVGGAVRKLKEMSKAMQIEDIASKDQILEMYLNIIYVGGGPEGKNLYGVEMASRYYFNKHASELSLAESAYIAGITHMPNLYNPYKENPETEEIKSRTKTVLSQMKKLGKIEEEQYNLAVQEVENGLAFSKGQTNNNILSYHTEAAVTQIAKQMAQEKGITVDAAKSILYGGGYTIYTTEKEEIQTAMEEEFKKDKYNRKPKKYEGNKIQAGMVMIDPTNGYVVASVGKLGEKTEVFGWNCATQSVRQPGSAIKPIAIVAPGLEEKVITAASVFDDVPTNFGGGYAPNNSYGGFKGLSNMRFIIQISQNVTAIKAMQVLTPAKSIEYMKQFGITTLQKEDDALSTALGGLTQGISPLEMGAAYATIANNGEYITPTFYVKVVDKEGKTVMEPQQEKRRVISEQNAYILKSILKEPVNGGTASAAAISGMDVAGKTGTTDSKEDRWICGFTPYYAYATWYGFEKKEPISGGNTAADLGAAVIKATHKNLEKKRFEKPSGIVNAAVCKDSGLLATDLCKEDQRGNRAYSEMFVAGTVPSKSCTCHVKAEICEETGKVANEYCPKKVEKVFITRENSDKNTSWQKAVDAQYMIPQETCEIHNASTDKDLPVITLIGDSVITLFVQSTYQELGAQAYDNIDGDITSKIVIEGTVDVSKAGTYTITYTVVDNAGNKAVATRTVNIVEKNDNNTNTNTGNNTTVDNGNQNQTDNSGIVDGNTVTP